MSMSAVKKGYFALSIVCITWSTTYLGMKYGTDQIPPFLMTGIRQITAGLLMLICLKYLMAKSISIDFKWKHLVPGLLMIGVCNGLITASVSYLPTGIVGVLTSIVPFWVVLINTNWRRLNIRRDGLKFIGLGIGFAGILLIFNSRDSSASIKSYIAIIFLLCATLAWTIGLILNKRIMLQTKNSLSLTAYQILSGGLVLIPVSLVSESYQNLHFRVQNISAVLYLAIFGSIIGFGAYNYSLKKLKPLIVSLSSFIIPIFSVIWGKLFENERVTYSVGFGILLILLGIFVAHKAEQKL